MPVKVSALSTFKSEDLDTLSIEEGCEEIILLKQNGEACKCRGYFGKEGNVLIRQIWVVKTLTDRV